MHNDIFGLKQDPIQLSHGPNLYCHSRSRKAVYSQMADQIREGRGILCVTGETGVGKSFLLQEITAELGTEVSFINMPIRGQDFRSLIAELCKEIGLEAHNEDIIAAVQSINDYRKKEKQAKPRIALIIDDAHHLSAYALDKVLLLSDPASDDSSSLQIILSGLPELEANIDQCRVPPYQQFMVYFHRVESLDSSEVGSFVKQRLDAWDMGYDDLFTPAAIARVAVYSNGIPRLINKICGSALSALGVQDSPSINEELIDRVAKDCLLAPRETASIRAAAKLDGSNSLEPEIDASMMNEDTLSVAESDAYENADAIENQRPTTEDSLTQTTTLANKQSHSSLDDAAEKNYTDNVEDRSQPIVNNKSAQRLVWTIAAALIILGGAIIVYQPNMSRILKNPPIVNLDAESPTQTSLLLDDSGQRIQTSPTFDALAPQTRKPKPRLEQIPAGLLIANGGKPGSAARTFLADIEKRSQPTNLNSIYDHAERLNEQHQPEDAYLLYFYAAKRGHSNAAFRLAQLTDPALFAQDSKMLEKSSVLQANKWYLRAAQAGHSEAGYYLKQLRGRVIAKAAAGDEEAQRLVMQIQ